MASKRLNTVPTVLIIAERTYCTSFDDWYSRVLILQDLLPFFPSLGLQVRNKTLASTREFACLLPQLKPCPQLWLNGTLSLKLPFQRHLPEDQIEEAVALSHFASSIHSQHALQKALRYSPQFLQYGAVFPTSKPVSPLGISHLQQICLSSPVPILAVGGINSLEKIIECKRAGAYGVSIGSWIMQANDMKQRIEGIA